MGLIYINSGSHNLVECDFLILGIGFFSVFQDNLLDTDFLFCLIIFLFLVSDPLRSELDLFCSFGKIWRRGDLKYIFS